MEEKPQVKEKVKRNFGYKQKNECWEKAEPVPGRSPARWRKDIAGNIVSRKLHSCDGCMCHEYDHIMPFAKGGATETSNCQILQTRVNRWKSDKVGVTVDELRKASCSISYSERELDLVEMVLFGDIQRRGRHYKVKSSGEQETFEEEGSEF